MKVIVWSIACLLWLQAARAQDSIYTCRNAEVSFFSSAPIEDIEARTNQGVSALNLQAGSIYFKIPVNTFQFEESLMQEHFNSDYMESDKYPYAEFKGQLQSADDLTKNGTHAVTVQGQLTMHGVSKDYQEKGTLIVQDSLVKASSTFKVRLADHHIKIPRLVIKNIAEVVDVKVSAAYTPGKG